MLGKMTSVAVIGPGRLEIAWDDGVVASVDLAQIIAQRAILAPLHLTEEFSQVRLSADGWSVEWPSGIDFGTAQLRRWADEQSGEVMPPDLFRSWMRHHRLTQEQAAQALGLSRRMIAYYASGEKPIPKTVWLATEGYASRIDA